MCRPVEGATEDEKQTFRERLAELQPIAEGTLQPDPPRKDDDLLIDDDHNGLAALKERQNWKPGLQILLITCDLDHSDELNGTFAHLRLCVCK
ncbi:hypothetical protein CERZMDRAFT_92052 [Cercospora zeae-maydis SCOH1-5]|uniref:Uncharacterized protein n=1 Tax=Cercospora zeae-maydis SCOH1-5 TaxID=717836 RepID=A0A6A6FVY2_9PEZI|nr:hypothetical protein CERZMDRAFT_92052 [Cercospora zeae-maydis SCOH1-5]